MNNKTLAVVLFAAVMTVTIGMQPVYAQTASGTANVQPATCGLEFLEGSTVNFGTFLDADIYTDGNALLKLNNTGNSVSNYAVSGNDWVNATNPAQTVMSANQTYFDFTNSDIFFDSPSDYPNVDTHPLTSTPKLAEPLGPSNQFWLYFGLIINLDDPLFVGSMTQDIIFTTECGN